LLILAALTLTTGALASVFEQSLSAQSLNETSNVGTISMQNLTGSLKVFPRLSQIIQSKANISVSTAVTAAEKAVGSGADAVSAYGYGERMQITMHASQNNNHIEFTRLHGGDLLSDLTLPKRFQQRD